MTHAALHAKEEEGKHRTIKSKDNKTMCKTQIMPATLSEIFNTPQFFLSKQLPHHQFFWVPMDLETIHLNQWAELQTMVSVRGFEIEPENIQM